MDLSRANSAQPTIMCMIRRVCHVIRTECASIQAIDRQRMSMGATPGMEDLVEEKEEDSDSEDDEENNGTGATSNQNNNSSVSSVTQRLEQTTLGLSSSGVHNGNKKKATASSSFTRESSASSQYSDYNRPTVTHSNSLQNLLMRTPSVGGVVDELMNTPAHKIKPGIIEELNEIIEDLSGSIHNIALQSMDHIHSNEIIMTSKYFSQ